MNDECRFEAELGALRCMTHAGCGIAPICAHAAVVLRAKVTRLQARVQELVAANEHWHTRVRQMKEQVESAEATVEELETLLRETERKLEQ